MHTYKDAIKGTKGAFILYPSKTDDISLFLESESECSGVGAIAMVPGQNYHRVKELLRRILLS